MKISLYLTVAEGRVWQGDTALWTKQIESGLALGPGERIVLWAHDADDPLDGPTWSVKNRHWGADGSINCDLERMVIDPDEDEQKEIMNLAGRHYAMSWYTASEDGRPEERLRAAGWRPYREV